MSVDIVRTTYVGFLVFAMTKPESVILLWSVFWSSAKTRSGNAEAAGGELDPTEVALANNAKKAA